MGVIYAIMTAVGVVIYAWLWYRAIIVSNEKKFSFAATIAIGMIATPLVALILVTFLPDPEESDDRRLTADELAAVFEAKAARMEAEKARRSAAPAQTF